MKKLFPILDLETTGLVVEPGDIMEVSVNIMTIDLESVETYTSAVTCGRDVLTRMNDWALKTHTESGLLFECLDRNKSKPLRTIEAEVVSLFTKHFKDQKVVLVGNSIHFDRKFIDRYMPDLSQHLHYRMLDVSAIWEFLGTFYDLKRPDNGPVVHRGVPDTRGSAKLLQQAKDTIAIATMARSLDKYPEDCIQCGAV